jgi:RNA polymerase sigma-70 factor (ECF subfamily)
MEARAVNAESENDRSAPAAFESFFRAQYPAVVRIAHGVVGEVHAAQDVAQDVFIAAERRFADSDFSPRAAVWVRVAAAHTALNTLRGQRRRHLRDLRAGAGAVPAGPEEIVLDRESRREVREALGRLPKRSATVLVLRHSGLSYAEVAEAMQVNAGQVGTMLRRAEVALRKEVERATRS